MFNTDACLGLSDEFIIFGAAEVPIHRELVKGYRRLQSDAQKAGYQLTAASGYRNFERQRLIWNAKASGQREVLDDEGRPIDIHDVNPDQLMHCILRWSALPGASRHHWGSEIDIYDAAKVGNKNQLQLVTSETESGGVFHAMYLWLEGYLANDQGLFYRPYEKDRNGIAPEPWHLSYRPIADVYLQALQPSLLYRLIESSELMLKEQVLKNFDEIWTRYVLNNE